MRLEDLTMETIRHEAVQPGTCLLLRGPVIIYVGMLEACPPVESGMTMVLSPIDYDDLGENLKKGAN